MSNPFWKATPIWRPIYIGGEISNFTNHYKSGHLYMSLKDENAIVKAVMFRAYASKLQFRPESGMKVIVKARVSLYEKDGSFQLYIEEMQPDGVGALQIAFEQLKKRLAAEGLFDESQKTSAAALSDPGGRDYFADRRGGAGYSQHSGPPLSDGAGHIRSRSGAGGGAAPSLLDARAAQ